MENYENPFTVEDLAQKIALLIKEDIVAIYTKEETTLRMQFLDGRIFQVLIEEVISNPHA